MARAVRKPVESQAGNPNLTNRLGRETGALIVPFDGGMGLMEQAEAILGERLVVTRMGYKLDGYIANTRQIITAAGLKFKDE